MRNAIRIAMAATALAVPVVATSQVAGSGLMTMGCTALADNFALDGELYAMKVTAAATTPRTDILYDARTKGESQSDPGTALDVNSWGIAPNWRPGPQAPTDVHFIIVTYDNHQIFIDSGDISSSSYDAGMIQTVGTSFTTPGQTIPGTSGVYTLDLGPANGTFPRGTTTNGINIAFPALAEGPIEVGGAGSFCYVGGALPDPSDTPTTGGANPTPTRGPIIGYNIYRIPGTAGTVPTEADFTAALSNANPNDGWQYFMDVRTFRLAAADTAPPGPGTPGGSETTGVTDLAGLQNPDSTPYSGDEVLIYQDAAGNSGTPRATGTAPVLTQSYWYMAQPVMTGRISEFSGTLGWTPNAFQNGVHQMDMDGDTLADALSLDTVQPHPAGNTPEFISPQAEAGLDGLGLTHDGLIFGTAPMFFDAASTLPATGQVSLTGTVRGNDVNISFTTGLEAGNVTGYNVYRMNGADPVRVNDQPILAQGNESNVYQVVEQTGDVRRLARGNTIQYQVEILYADGTTRMVGPFTVTLEQQAPARRRR